jgi:hypothetical protein
VRISKGWVVAAAATLVAACGSDAKGATASPGGLAAKSADQIVRAAQAAARGASGYEIRGRGDFGSGLTAFDFKVHGQDLDGTLTDRGQTADLARVGGNIYLSGPAAFWTAAGLTPLEATLLAGHWVEAPAGSAAAKQLSALSTLTDVSASLSQHGPLAKDGTAVIGGQPVVRVRDTSDGSILAVATSGPAYPVRLTTDGSRVTTVDLSGWGTIPLITPPPSPIVLPG